MHLWLIHLLDHVVGPGDWKKGKERGEGGVGGDEST